MDLIYQNPFRVLGLSIDASEREVAKRVSDMETYAELGKKVTYDTDFPFLAEIKRTPETIREAAHRIETIEGRFYHSLFWFWRNNSADELALDVLKEGNVDKAINLLEKQFPVATPSTRSHSSAKNLAVLCLASASRNGSYDFKMLSQGLKWAGKVLSTSSLEEYAELVVGKTFVPERKKVTEPFVNEVIRTFSPHLDRPDGITLPQFIRQFNTFPEDTQRQVTARFTGSLIKNIEDAILIAENRRNKVPGEADRAGDDLYNLTIIELNKLDSILSTEHIEYQAIADKLANELLQCSIDYNNYHIKNSSGVDPDDNALSLCQYAEKIAIGLKVKERIKANIAIMEQNLSVTHEHKKLYGNLTPISSAPSLSSFNGVGFTLYGETDVDSESNSHLATYYFIVFFIPVFPICRYRVIPTNGGYRFLGKAPLRTIDKWHLAISIGLILLLSFK